jgi:hypothetical protein
LPFQILAGVAVWRRRRTANTRAAAKIEEAAINSMNEDVAADNIGVAVIYNPLYLPGDNPAVVDMPIPVPQPWRSIRNTFCPVRFSGGLAWP